MRNTCHVLLPGLFGGMVIFAVHLHNCQHVKCAQHIGGRVGGYHTAQRRFCFSIISLLLVQVGQQKIVFGPRIMQPTEQFTIAILIGVLLQSGFYV